MLALWDIEEAHRVRQRGPGRVGSRKLRHVDQVVLHQDQQGRADQRRLQGFAVSHYVVKRRAAWVPRDQQVCDSFHDRPEVLLDGVARQSAERRGRRGDGSGSGSGSHDVLNPLGGPRLCVFVYSRPKSACDAF